MKKEIRLYFNLTNEIDKQVYEYLNDKRSSSIYIIDLVRNEMNSLKGTELIAAELRAIAKALTGCSIAQENTQEICEDEFILNLTDNFDDEY